MRLAAGQAPCTDEELAEFMSLHERARSLGFQDEVVLALTQALEFKGAQVKARNLFQSYMSARRDGFPLMKPLASRMHDHLRTAS
jgi:hypothetical protein